MPWPGGSKCLSELCELNSHGAHSMVSTSGTQLKVSTSEGKGKTPYHDQRTQGVSLCLSRHLPVALGSFLTHNIFLLVARSMAGDQRDPPQLYLKKAAKGTGY